MDNAMFHALEWMRAVEQKSAMQPDSPEHQILDTVIAFERTQAWMSIAREMIKDVNSHSLLVVGLTSQNKIPYEEANKLATILLALGYAEAEGNEITSEIFHNAFNIEF